VVFVPVVCLRKGTYRREVTHPQAQVDSWQDQALRLTTVDSSSRPSPYPAFPALVKSEGTSGNALPSS
jgi:hypothetical protein